MRWSIAGLNDKHSFSFGQADDGLSARVEFQKILLDAVAEDHAVLSHLRFERERCFRCYAPKHNGSPRRTGGKWFAHREKEIIRVPCEFCFDVYAGLGLL